MNHRYLVAVFTVIAVTALAAVPVAAQTAPRTPWGTPDLQGIWDFRTITPLERPEDLGDQAFYTPEEAATLEREAVERDIELLGTGGAENRGRRERRRLQQLLDGPGHPADRDAAHVADHGSPDRTVSGAVRGRSRARGGAARAHGRAPADSYTDRNSSDRCIVGFNAGPPITPLAYNQNMQLFQTPDYVVIHTEMVHTSRFVPLDGRPALDPDIRLWSGDSRGYWEGDTLVIESANFNDRRQWIPLTSGGSGVASSENMTLVERFTRLDDDTLEYTFTLTDLDTWAIPWTASMPMQRADTPLFEYACHEGNYSMEGILSGARADDRAAAAGSQ